MITATNNGGVRFDPIEAGSYPARCYSMVQIGTIEEVIQGKVKHLNKVRISWELPTELKVYKEGEGEKPAIISKEFTLSMNEKATLRKFLEGWRGLAFTDEESKAFDITALLGVPCMLTIIHKKSQSSGNTYAEISSVSKVPKGMTVPPQINETFVLSYDDWSEEKFNSLPEFLRNKIVSSDEYKVLNAPHETNSGGQDNEPPDDLPF